LRAHFEVRLALPETALGIRNLALDDLERELPEAMKPRRIAVESKPASATKVAQGTKMLEAAEKAA
jgi:hypothetical protein